MRKEQKIPLNKGIISDQIFPLASYKNDPEILAMTNLVSAYQRKEIGEFEKILKGFNFFIFLLSMFVGEIIQ